MESEIIICPECKSEYELTYFNDEVIHQTKCKCKPTILSLDEVFKILEQKGLLREKH
jgi:uncharacterized protein YbaR (Trm112 family)